VIVTLNGERREVADGATVATLVSILSGGGPDPRGVAVAVAGEVVPRGQWASTPVGEGAQVEVVAAIQGG
jgi:sulfur carrier protein